MEKVRILAFTDFHGNQEAYQRAKNMIVAEKPDFVIVAGDITNYDAKSAKQSLSDLANANRPIYFVPGNMDNPELAVWQGSGNVHGLHGRCEYWESICLMGLGGSPHGPFTTPFEFSEEEAAELLESAAKGYRGGKLILVSHCPPKSTKIDRVSVGLHAGSTSVRKFVEKMQPILVVSGHIHEAQGTDMIGTSTLVNTGPAHRGEYAQITLYDKATVKFAKLF